MLVKHQIPMSSWKKFGYSSLDAKGNVGKNWVKLADGAITTKKRNGIRLRIKQRIPMFPWKKPGSCSWDAKGMVMRKGPACIPAAMCKKNAEAFGYLLFTESQISNSHEPNWLILRRDKENNRIRLQFKQRIPMYSWKKSGRCSLDAKGMLAKNKSNWLMAR